MDEVSPKRKVSSPLKLYSSPQRELIVLETQTNYGKSKYQLKEKLNDRKDKKDQKEEKSKQLKALNFLQSYGKELRSEQNGSVHGIKDEI